MVSDISFRFVFVRAARVKFNLGKQNNIITEATMISGFYSRKLKIENYNNYKITEQSSLQPCLTNFVSP